MEEHSMLFLSLTQSLGKASLQAFAVYWRNIPRLRIDTMLFQALKGIEESWILIMKDIRLS
jgi:hypothetical protein